MTVFYWLVLVTAALLVGILIGRSLEFSDTLDVPANRKYQLTVLSQILDVIPDAAAIIDIDMTVLARSFNCVSLGLVSGDTLANPALVAFVDNAQDSKDQVIDEISMRRTDNTEWQARILVFPLSNGLSVVIAQDLSEEQRLAEVRRDFVANVSHELKTPIGALSLLAEAVQAADTDTEQVAKFTSRMQSEVRRLNEMISDLVELSEVQSEAPLRNAQPVPVVVVINEALDAMKTVAEYKSISLTAENISSDIEIFGDEDQLVTAVRNLVSNAINYSSANTEVVVSVDADDDAVRINISDQGPGISPENQQRIFERFYRVDPARSRETGGTGLGLAIVKHVCVNHGGEVSVESQSGKGSTFTLHLPRYVHGNQVGTL